MIENQLNKPTAALICAAGRSSRMGECKPLLPIGDETLLRRGIITMQQAGAAIVVVVAGREAKKVSDSVADLNVEIVHNKEYETNQMFDSVKMGLTVLKGRCGKVLFSPVDIPLYRKETVEMLLASHERVCAPSYRGVSGHPVCFQGALIDEILSYEGPGGLAGALKSLGETALIECQDEGILIESDTPAEYERMKEYYARNLSDPAR